RHLLEVEREHLAHGLLGPAGGALRLHLLATRAPAPGLARLLEGGRVGVVVLELVDRLGDDGTVAVVLDRHVIASKASKMVSWSGCCSGAGSSPTGTGRRPPG